MVGRDDGLRLSRRSDTATPGVAVSLTGKAGDWKAGGSSAKESKMESSLTENFPSKGTGYWARKTWFRFKSPDCDVPVHPARRTADTRPGRPGPHDRQLLVHEDALDHDAVDPGKPQLLMRRARRQQRRPLRCTHVKSALPPEDPVVGAPAHLVERVGELAAIGASRIHLRLTDVTDLDDLRVGCGDEGHVVVKAVVGPAS
ncbi:hypothetical protein ACF1BU_33910 [Streptomyces sp. NPDC014724]|uniref:hypothetical protein n=1 Tax=unclassified Streptomyces TaxID=2593676 RepID=UPI003701C003